jgi:hypothetical protein
VTLGELEADVRSGLRSLEEEVLQGLVDVMGSGKTKYPPCHPPDSARVFNDNDSEQQSSATRCTASMFAKTPR